MRPHICTTCGRRREQHRAVTIASPSDLPNLNEGLPIVVLLCPEGGAAVPEAAEFTRLPWWSRWWSRAVGGPALKIDVTKRRADLLHYDIEQRRDDQGLRSRAPLRTLPFR